MGKRPPVSAAFRFDRTPELHAIRPAAPPYIVQYTWSIAAGRDLRVGNDALVRPGHASTETPSLASELISGSRLHITSAAGRYASARTGRCTPLPRVMHVLNRPNIDAVKSREKCMLSDQRPRRT
jgi:hypothetical protein